MSRLECITDDVEEEITLRIKDLNLHMLPSDFDYEALLLEIAQKSDLHSALFPIRMHQMADRLTKLTLDYKALVMTTSAALDLNLKAAEARIAEREVPMILKKMEEG